MKEVTDDKEKYKPRNSDANKIDTFQHLHDIASGKTPISQSDGQKPEHKIPPLMSQRTHTPNKPPPPSNQAISATDLTDEIDLSMFGLPSAFGTTKRDDDWESPGGRNNMNRRGQFNAPFGQGNKDNKFDSNDKVPRSFHGASQHLTGAPISSVARPPLPGQRPPLPQNLHGPQGGLGLVPTPPGPPPTPPRGPPPPRQEIIMDNTHLSMPEGIRPGSNILFSAPPPHMGLVRTGVPHGMQPQQILLNPILQAHPALRMQQFSAARLQFPGQMAGLQNVIHMNRIPGVPSTSDSIAMSQQQPPEFIVDGTLTHGMRPPMPPPPDMPGLTLGPQMTLQQLVPHTSSVVRVSTPEGTISMSQAQAANMASNSFITLSFFNL
jgi:hypothetical protein